MPGERGDGGTGGVGGFDPSNLHLKKELTQIKKKAARMLRDPGTTSSWRSPLNSSGSIAPQDQYHHDKVDFGTHGNIESQSRIPLAINSSTNIVSKEKDKKVFLYNWRSQKSESEKSRKYCDDGIKFGNHDVIEAFSSAQEDEDNLSYGGHYGNDSKSDTFVTDNYASMLFKSKDTAFTPVQRINRKKTKKNKYSNSILRRKRASRGLGSEYLSSLVDQSDYADDYLNADDLLWRFSADSPLLARLRNKKSSYSSSKLLRRTRKENSSYSYGTPTLSTSSYGRYAVRYPGTEKSWDAITGSFHDADDEVDDPLDFPGRQGCGIPCYWSRRSTPKSKGGFGSCFSPSLSETLRIRRSSSKGYNKRKSTSRTAAQVHLPLLRNHVDDQLGSSVGTCNSNDELQAKIEELKMEGSSRLDRKRWFANNRSQDGLEKEVSSLEEEQDSTESFPSLSQKYKPMFFEELVGQNVVVQSLMNAVSRKRIAPVYLFQGPHGTGKTSTSLVFAAALNCLVSEEIKPCGICKECTDFVSGKSKNLAEFDASDKNSIVALQYLLKSILACSSSSFLGYKIIVVNECHLLSSKTWIYFLKFLEELPPRFIFILKTTDLDNVPQTVLSRCQKYIFNKIKDVDIVTRLKKLVAEEKLVVDSEALDLIAVNANGSLQYAESMLDQLSLLGKRITVSLVNELVGVISDDQLLELLELAMSSNTVETVKRCGEVIDSGADPVIVVSQMATLIMDIITGSYSIDDKKPDLFFGGRSLNEAELKELKHALKLLSVAEKQFRVSDEPSTWFTATLLQLSSVSATHQTRSGGSRRQSSKTIEDEPSHDHRIDPQYAFPGSHSPMSIVNAVQPKSSNKEASPDASRKITPIHVNSKLLGDIWMRCVEECHSKALKQVLYTYGKLVTISKVEGAFVAYIAFKNDEVKSQAERFHSSIKSSFETVLRRNVSVKITLFPDGDTSLDASVHPKTELGRIYYTNKNGFSDKDSYDDARSLYGCEEQGKKVEPLRRIESIIQEQRLETAWLQAMEKGTPGNSNHLRPERNQVLPQDGIYNDNQLELNMSCRPWEDGLIHETECAKIDDDNGKIVQKNKVNGKIESYPLSPSLLHDSSFTKEKSGYESGSGKYGCSGFFCWRNSRPSNKIKVLHK